MDRPAGMESFHLQVQIGIPSALPPYAQWSNNATFQPAMLQLLMRQLQMLSYLGMQLIRLLDQANMFIDLIQLC